MNEVFREEKKYFITVPDCIKISGALEKVMLQDSHNGAAGYPIRSLYFDTPYDTDFTDKIEGLEIRKKIRLRIYDPKSDFAMLEMKQKQGAYQKKRSLRITKKDACQMSCGDYSVLLAYKDPFAAECYGLMKMKCYRPKTLVEYRRKAFIAKENKIRVTFDSGIAATEACFDLFSERMALYPVLDSFHCVMEVKYNGFILSYIKDLINLSDRQTLSVSKYCLARSVSMHYRL